MSMNPVSTFTRSGRLGRSAPIAVALILLSSPSWAQGPGAAATPPVPSTGPAQPAAPQPAAPAPQPEADAPAASASETAEPAAADAPQPPATDATAPAAAECFPECRKGYLCHQGQCVSRCNPRCADGETCLDDGICQAASPPPAATPALEAPATAAAEPAPAATTTAPPAADADDGDLGPQRWALGAAAGVTFPSSVSVDGFDVDTESNFLLDAWVDWILVSAFSMGAYFTYAPMSAEDGYGDATLFSVGVTLKARIALSNRVKLRPGLVVGYNSISIDDLDDSSDGFNPGLHVDVAIATGKSGAVVPRFGFFSQPAGGTSDFDLTFAPHPYIAVGYEFGS